MTYKQADWARTHDWWVSTDINDGLVSRVWVKSNRPEGGILPFSDYQRLRKWAGY